MHDPAVSGSKNRSDGSKLGASTFEGKKASAAPVAQDPPTADGTNDDEDTIEVAQLSRASLRDREMRTSMGLPPLSYVSKTDNKRLAIDGRPALLAPSNDDMIQVYDYGGKTYAVKGDEKKEWLKNVRMIPRSTSRYVRNDFLKCSGENK